MSPLVVLCFGNDLDALHIPINFEVHVHTLQWGRHCSAVSAVHGEWIAIQARAPPAILHEISRGRCSDDIIIQIRRTVRIHRQWIRQRIMRTGGVDPRVLHDGVGHRARAILRGEGSDLFDSPSVVEPRPVGQAEVGQSWAVDVSNTDRVPVGNFEGSPSASFREYPLTLNAAVVQNLGKPLRTDGRPPRTRGPPSSTDGHKSDSRQDRDLLRALVLHTPDVVPRCRDLDSPISVVAGPLRQGGQGEVGNPGLATKGGGCGGRSCARICESEELQPRCHCGYVDVNVQINLRYRLTITIQYLDSDHVSHPTFVPSSQSSQRV
mmetsp:Transcript_933/g.2294  ORF Transcript_933/g.2294 Transcript_933/m.2294 type:complete len:322 (+) Transcript_933:3436-4401(+)